MAARARPVAALAGAEDDIMEYVKRIRALRWLAMALRAQETAQVRTAASASWRLAGAVYPHGAARWFGQRWCRPCVRAHAWTRQRHSYVVRMWA